jgi:hypothetical protein
LTPGFGIPYKGDLPRDHSLNLEYTIPNLAKTMLSVSFFLINFGRTKNSSVDNKKTNNNSVW